MKIRKMTNQEDMYGTSFHNGTITATTNELIAEFGKCDYYQPNDEYEKVTREWDLELEDGTPFTIYDWKEYRVYDDEVVIEWHIGTRNKEDSTKVVRALKKIGF